MAGSDQPQPHIPSVLEDPGSGAVARMYAKAFVAAAQGVGVESALEEFDSFVTDVLDKQPEFYSVLCTPYGNRDHKLELIQRVIAPFGSPLFVNFLRVLARKGRLDLLPLIRKESRLRHEFLQGRRRVQVTSAIQMTDERLERLRGQLAAMLPFEPIIELKVDPTLMGGVVIRVGDTVYDSSVKTRMKQLRERLRQRSLHEIQSGRDRFSHPE